MKKLKTTTLYSIVNRLNIAFPFLGTAIKCFKYIAGNDYHLSQGKENATGKTNGNFEGNW